MYQDYAIKTRYSKLAGELNSEKDFYHKNPKRMTPGQLFQTVIEQMQEDGHFDEASYILDYISPETLDRRTLCSYQFDVRAVVNRGGSEGVYLDIWLDGECDTSGNHKVAIGTLKTLKEGLGAYTILGRLAGTFVYYAERFINSNLSLFMSEDELAENKKREQ